MAQLGSAPALGAGGRRFESDQPDLPKSHPVDYPRPVSASRWLFPSGGNDSGFRIRVVSGLWRIAEYVVLGGSRRV